MRTLIGIMAFLVVCSAVTGLTVSEHTWSEFGFSGISVDGTDQNGCQDMTFLVDENDLVAGNYGILSLKADFLPVASEDANVSVYINYDVNGVSVESTKFKNGWFRWNLSADQLKKDVYVQVCAQTSNSTTRIDVSDESVFGVYQKPVFTKTDFVKRIQRTDLLVGEEFEITVSLTNSGSEAVDVNVFYKKPYVPYDAILYVKGQSQYLGTIAPGKTVEYSYIGKSTKSGMVTVPAAIVTFTNIFGEEETLISNYPVIQIDDAPVAVSGVVLNKGTQKRVFVFQEVPVQIVVKNNGLTEIKNLSIALNQNESLVFSPQPTHALAELKAGESRTLEFSVAPSTEGRFELGCLLTYQDSNIRQTDCQPTSIVVEPQPQRTELLAAVVLVLTAVLVFLYYHFRKV